MFMLMAQAFAGELVTDRNFDLDTWATKLLAEREKRAIEIGERADQHDLVLVAVPRGRGQALANGLVDGTFMHGSAHLREDGRRSEPEALAEIELKERNRKLEEETFEDGQWVIETYDPEHGRWVVAIGPEWKLPYNDRQEALKAMQDSELKNSSLRATRVGTHTSVSPNGSIDTGCRCWNEGQYGRVHREDCPIH